MSEDARNRLRTTCLKLPDAAEEYGGVGSPSYKVRDKIFAMQHPMNDRPSLWMKAPKGFQEVITNAEPERFFVPPYVGHHGWIGLWLDVEQDWGFVADLIEDSYRITAPKKLIKQLEERKKQ